MVTALGSTMADAAKAFAKPVKADKVNSLDAIKAHFQRNGFLREVAGENDFDKVAKAVRQAQETHRGIMLYGGNGVGKSLAMRIYYEGIKTTYKEWIDCNNAISLGWLDQPYLENVHVFIDDFGGERMLYGDQDLVGAFIVRWHTYHNPSKIMCITTNLDSNQVNERYGGRVLDRIKELCVLCSLEGESKRKKEEV